MKGIHATLRVVTREKSVLPVLSDRDVLVKSEIGSVKALSHVLPIVQNLQAVEPRIERKDGGMTLILAPTREFRPQIPERVAKLI